MYLLQTLTTANANKSDHFTTVTFMDHQAIKCPALINQEINTDIVPLMCLFLPVNSVKWNSKFIVNSNIQWSIRAHRKHLFKVTAIIQCCKMLTLSYL